MNDTASSYSSILTAVSYQLNIYFGSFLLVAGNLGCMGNIILFLSPTLRERAYSIYLLWEAISDFLYFNFVLMTRVLQYGFKIPILTRYDVLCKLRQFLTDWSNQVSFSFFAFATIDRLLSTQRANKYRQWSNRADLALKICLICVFVWLLLFGHRLILYSATKGACIPLPGFYAYFDAYNEIFFKAICPPIVMIGLAHLLIRSVRGVIQRKVGLSDSKLPAIVACRSTIDQIDSRLTLMLILQTIIALITYIPFAIQLIYSNITQHWPKSTLRNAQESVFAQLTHLLSYTFFATSFYISIITNVGFRRQIKKFFKKSRLNDRSTNTNAAFRADLTITMHTK
ncbi:unnamed protein product [Rotaria magnacalcarata]|uniref:G-protein coupled receptors family 1 profile domain-containing protein n=1 Tax=Rotaria magnacalcarata TaxID=392030 RepID=A0A816PKD6_9BILA|nr:unnamed protein product [Rotaria magnacalcarata]CAF4245642.1 unnamed protein product [Rotaria magnacalcarata]